MLSTENDPTPPPPRYTLCEYILFINIFGGDFFSYYIQHCFICRPSDSTVPTDAGIEPRTIATGALASVADPGCLFRIRPFSIPDPGSELSPSRIRIKEFKYFNPKKAKKWFLSSRKYDPGCSSRIPDPDADFLPIPDPGAKKAPDPGSGSATLALAVRRSSH